MPVVATIAAVLSVVGTGVSYVSAMNAANTQETFTQLNMQAGMQQAEQQGSIAAMQAQLQAAQADTAAKSAADNAEAMRQQAEMDAKIGQENIRRNRDDFARQLAQATAEQGASGAVVAQGSPLDFLVNAADMEDQQEQSDAYGINAGRAAGFRQAAGAALGGRVQGVNASLYQLESLSAIQQGRVASTQARLGGYAGQSQAAGMRSSAFGGLISGAAGAATTYASTWAKKKY